MAEAAGAGQDLALSSRAGRRGDVGARGAVVAAAAAVCSIGIDVGLAAVRRVGVAVAETRHAALESASARNASAGGVREFGAGRAVVNLAIAVVVQAIAAFRGRRDLAVASSEEAAAAGALARAASADAERCDGAGVARAQVAGHARRARGVAGVGAAREREARGHLGFAGHGHAQVIGHVERKADGLHRPEAHAETPDCRRDRLRFGPEGRPAGRLVVDGESDADGLLDRLSLGRGELPLEVDGLRWFGRHRPGYEQADGARNGGC